MPNPEHRIVTHEDGDTRVIAVLQRTAENDQLTDEEIVARFNAWKREQRHLRAVDSE